MSLPDKKTGRQGGLGQHASCPKDLFDEKGH
jgi:hypothetical protein